MRYILVNTIVGTPSWELAIVPMSLSEDDARIVAFRVVNSKRERDWTEVRDRTAVVKTHEISEETGRVMRDFA